MRAAQFFFPLVKWFSVWDTNKGKIIKKFCFNFWPPPSSPQSQNLGAQGGSKNGKKIKIIISFICVTNQKPFQPGSITFLKKNNNKFLAALDNMLVEKGHLRMQDT